MNFVIKGSSFYQSNLSYVMNKELELGGLYLRRDFHNEFDPFATGVFCAGHQLGWIPAGSNKQLSIDLDNGVEYSAEVITWNTAYDKDTFIGLTIKLEKEATMNERTSKSRK